MMTVQERKAFQITAGALQAVAARSPKRESEVVVFSGKWNHLGRMTVRQVLDMANEILEPKS